MPVRACLLFCRSFSPTLSSFYTFLNHLSACVLNVCPCLYVRHFLGLSFSPVSCSFYASLNHLAVCMLCIKCLSVLLSVCHFVGRSVRHYVRFIPSWTVSWTFITNLKTKKTKTNTLYLSLLVSGCLHVHLCQFVLFCLPTSHSFIVSVQFTVKMLLLFSYITEWQWWWRWRWRR